MEVQVLEFGYDSTNPDEVEDRMNSYLHHHVVVDVQVQPWEDPLLAFVFVESYRDHSPRRFSVVIRLPWFAGSWSPHRTAGIAAGSTTTPERPSRRPSRADASTSPAPTERSRFWSDRRGRSSIRRPDGRRRTFATTCSLSRKDIRRPNN